MFAQNDRSSSFYFERSVRGRTRDRRMGDPERRPSDPTGEPHSVGRCCRVAPFRTDITGIDLTGTTIEPKELKIISGLTGLRELYLPGPSWTPFSGSRLDANAELKSGSAKLNRA